MTFEEAVQLILNIEGGEVNDKFDPGGETKFGISQKAYPNLDIENLTQSEAWDIYKRDFWDKIKLDDLPDFLRLAIFDAAVNSGASQAIRFLQSCLGVHEDGVIGPQTVHACASSPLSNVEFLALYLEKREEFYRSLDTYSHFGKGWTKRLFMVAVQSKI